MRVFLTTSQWCDDLRQAQEVSTWDELKIFWDFQPLNPCLPGTAEEIGHKMLLPILQVQTVVKLDKLTLLYDLFTDWKTKTLVGLHIVSFAPVQPSALISTSKPSD